MTDRYWALLSGGKDSVCTASGLCEAGKLAGCVFMDTRIAAPTTRPFVEKLCRDQGWPLRVSEAPTTYEDLVRRYGFPKGPRGHTIAYGVLKERPLILAEKAIRAETGERPVFASGVRRFESSRRSRSVKMGEGRYRDRGFNIVAPISDWATADVWAYLRERGLPVSPAYTTIGISGDCLCGAFSGPGEAAAILAQYDQLAARIRGLEDEVRDRFRYPRNRWGGFRSPGGFTSLRGRTTLEGFLCGGDCRIAEGGA